MVDNPTKTLFGGKRLKYHVVEVNTVRLRDVINGMMNQLVDIDMTGYRSCTIILLSRLEKRFLIVYGIIILLQVCNFVFDAGYVHLAGIQYGLYHYFAK
jgi:hypothetical protein